MSTIDAIPGALVLIASTVAITAPMEYATANQMDATVILDTKERYAAKVSLYI